MGQQGILLSFFFVLVSGNVFGREVLNADSKEDSVKYEIVVKDVEAQPALVMKGKVEIEKAGEAIGGILGRIGAHLGAKQIDPVGAPFTRTFNFENGVLEFESGFPVPAGVAGEGEILATELPRGKAACTMHVGSQEKSPEAYEALHAWMAANDKQAAGAPWEMYLTDSATVPEDEAEMEVCFPVL